MLSARCIRHLKHNILNGCCLSRRPMKSEDSSGWGYGSHINNKIANLPPEDICCAIAQPIGSILRGTSASSRNHESMRGLPYLHQSPMHLQLWKHRWLWWQEGNWDCQTAKYSNSQRSGLRRCMFPVGSKSIKWSALTTHKEHVLTKGQTY